MVFRALPGAAELDRLVKLRQEQGLEGPFITWDWLRLLTITLVVIGAAVVGYLLLKPPKPKTDKNPKGSS